MIRYGQFLIGRADEDIETDTCTEGNVTERQTQREGDHVAVEVRTGATQPQLKKRQALLVTTRSVRKQGPADTLDLGFQPSELGEDKSFCWLSCSYCVAFSSVQFSSVAQSCPTLCDPMNRSTPGLPVHHHLPEFTQTHVHRVHDAIQPSHPRSSPSPPAPNPSQHQSLFQ